METYLNNHIINMELRPQEALNNLRKFSSMINDLTDKIVDARTKSTLAEAAYIDAKAASYTARSKEMSATAAQNWVSVDTKEEKKAYILAESELKNLQDELNVIETSNNSLKLAIRLMDMEIKNLGNPQL